MQQNLPNTKATAKNRIVGTLISGFYSVVVIFILTRILSIELNSLIYYIIISLLIMPLMTLLVNLHLEKSVLVASVVYILCCATNRGNQAPIQFMIYRVIDSTLGILVSLLINWLPLLNRSNE